MKIACDFRRQTRVLFPGPFFPTPGPLRFLWNLRGPGVGKKGPGKRTDFLRFPRGPDRRSGPPGGFFSEPVPPENGMPFSGGQEHEMARRKTRESKEISEKRTLVCRRKERSIFLFQKSGKQRFSPGTDRRSINFSWKRKIFDFSFPGKIDRSSIGARRERSSSVENRKRFSTEDGGFSPISLKWEETTGEKHGFSPSHSWLGGNDGKKDRRSFFPRIGGNPFFLSWAPISNRCPEGFFFFFFFFFFQGEKLFLPSHKWGTFRGIRQIQRGRGRSEII